MELAREMAYEREKGEKTKQKTYYDQKARVRAFEVGSFVLVFRPTLKDKLVNQWQGPLPVAKVLTPVTYKVDLGGRSKQYRTFHISCMKEWKSPSVAVFMAEEGKCESMSEERERENRDTNMPELQLRELEKFKERYKDMLSDTPGRTHLACHNIPTGDAHPVPPYRLAHKAQEILREEIQTLLNQGIIRPSTSPWAAPIVLVPKKDGTRRMCVD